MNNKEVDTSQVLAMFAELDEKNQAKVYKNAVRQSLNIVKKQTLINLAGVINPEKIGKKDKWGNSFRSGVTIKVYKSGKSGVIHIMKNFKMKFFELGTEKRYRKCKGLLKRLKYRKSKEKYGYTGQIKGKHFFRNAQQQTETKVFSSIDSIVTKNIQRINKKYNKGI